MGGCVFGKAERGCRNLLSSSSTGSGMEDKDCPRLAIGDVQHRQAARASHGPVASSIDSVAPVTSGLQDETATRNYRSFGSSFSFPRSFSSSTSFVPYTQISEALEQSGAASSHRPRLVEHPFGSDSSSWNCGISSVEMRDNHTASIPLNELEPKGTCVASVTPCLTLIGYGRILSFCCRSSGPRRRGELDCNLVAVGTAGNCAWPGSGHMGQRKSIGK